MNAISKYYNSYKNSIEKFDKFHNEVINMPRDHFSDMGFEKIKIIAGYLLITEDTLSQKICNYKEILECIHNKMGLGIYPKIRDKDLEDQYFIYTKTINEHYKNVGRMFRHVMGLAVFFGLIISEAKQRKIINFEKCKEYVLSDNKTFMPVARNNLIMLMVKNNDYIKALSGIQYGLESDYRPAAAILKYMELIHRPVTKFEISILLGRVDEVYSHADILKRALDIGRELPIRNEKEQKYYFFSNMGWKFENGTFFEYASSQSPDFKFNNFIVLMEQFELIKCIQNGKKYELTEYGKKIISDDISYLVADLENLIDIIENSDVDKEIADIIINQRNPELLELAKNDDKFIKKMNLRSIKYPKCDKDGKRVRNRLIAELAKIMVDYKCQYKQDHVFKMENGKYYCEAHHILEFSTENGPDITNNLIVLGPEAHAAIHHGNSMERDNIFLQLIKNGSIQLKQFEEMITEYHCLNKNQILILEERKVITKKEKEHLLDLIAE